jgi:hypothetical protein
MKNNILFDSRLPALRVLCVAILFVASASTALAQDWRLEPIFRVGGEFDDNATLNPRTDEEIQLTGLLFDASVDVDFSSPTTSFSMQPSARLRRYDDDAVLDSNDYFLRSTLRHQAGLNTLGFRVNYDRQPVRNAERLDTDLEIEDPDEISNDDTGRTLNVGTRDRWRISPYWEYELSNVSLISADFNYTDARYEKVPGLLLVDFSDALLNLNFRRSLSNVTSWVVSLSGRTFDTEDLSDEVDTVGVSFGIRHALSEKTAIDARVGLEDQDQSGFDTDPEVVGHLRLSRRLDIIRLFAEYRRSVYGSGAGTLSARNSINLNFRRRLNDKISAGLGVRAYQDSRLAGIISATERNYVQLQSSFTWYLSRAFAIEADYRYTVIDRDNSIGELANSNQVTLWLTYQPNTVPEI